MIERYQIKEKIGQGGLGEVFLAMDTQLQREVALKRVRAAEGQSPEDVLREAKVLSALQHPNILTVFDVGQDETGPFVVTELLRGETLEQVVGRGTLGHDDFRQMAIQTLEGMVAAQSMSLIHRDLKPGNLMVVRHASGRFQLKILDFGLAKFSRHASRQTEDQEAGIMGSIHFMAPEQFERAPLDGRTDLYALGCIFYFSLSGKNPFEGDSPAVIMAAHLAHHVTPLAQLRPDLPLWACDWVMWFLNRQPDDRPSNAQQALDTFQEQSQAWDAAMQAAPLAAMAAMAGGSASAAAGRAPTGPVRVAAPARPAPTVAARATDTVRIAKRRPAKPAWLMYGVPAVVLAGVAYGLWEFKTQRDEAALSSGGGLTVDDLGFPDVADASTLKGLAVGEGTTPLNIDQARIVGTKARRRSSIQAIGYWSNPDTRVVWDVVITKVGRYEVRVTQSVEDAKTGGTYEVSLAGSTVTGEAQRTPNREQFVEVSLGTLAVDKKGPATLEMRPTKVIGTSLMNLGGISLRKQ